MARETQQDKILAMHEEGFTPREIYNEIEGSYGSVYSILSKFKLKPNQRRCPNCGQHYSISNP